MNNSMNGNKTLEQALGRSWGAISSQVTVYRGGMMGKNYGQHRKEKDTHPSSGMCDCSFCVDAELRAQETALLGQAYDV